MDLERDGNLIEAGVWFLCGAALLWKTFTTERCLRSTLLMLVVALFVFGGSDIVESRTGAWWRPWWLFVWKAACVVVLLVGFWRYYRLSKQLVGRQSSDGPAERGETMK